MLIKESLLASLCGMWSRFEMFNAKHFLISASRLVFFFRAQTSAQRCSASCARPVLSSCTVYVCSCLGGGGIEGVAVACWSCPHTGPCSSWQIKMNSVLFGSGSPFIIFHFAQCASQPSAAACHVKTLYQALTAPPMHTHHAHGSYTLDFCSHTLPSTCSPTYLGNICSDLSH